MKISEFKQLAKGKIFSCTFEKKNREKRRMICRLGVKAYLKGGELSYDAEAVNNLIVFDMEKKGYRTVSFDRLQEIKFGGKVYSEEEFSKLSAEDLTKEII